MAEEKPKKAEGTEPKPPVTFSPEQIALIDKMFEERTKSMTQRPDKPNAISMYNIRDPKKIETVKVSRFDAKWVIGFKNLQNDPFKKMPKYLRYGVEPIRKLPNEPYVTLLLSNDGKEIIEKELLLVDYMEYRDQKDVPVVKCNIQEVINDHGVLGSSSQFAIAVNDKGNPEARPTILQQSKSEIRTFDVKLPTFDAQGEPDGEFDYTFSTDFLG